VTNDLFSGDKVRLVALGTADAPHLARWSQDGQYLRLLDAAAARPMTVAAAEKRIEEANGSTTGYLFGLRTLDSDEMIGFVELDDILWNQRVGWIALGIGEQAHRGHGFGSEAMQLVLNFAFQELNLRRVQLTVFEYNEPALALYRQLGFQHEGTFRKFLERDSRVYDMYLMGLLREEWELATKKTGQS
jgi:RimJ/RimL family protein N-acetyltransferase